MLQARASVHSSPGVSRNEMNSPGRRSRGRSAVITPGLISMHHDLVVGFALFALRLRRRESLLFLLERPSERVVFTREEKYYIKLHEAKALCLTNSNSNDLASKRARAGRNESI